jgi:FlaA1/EpsC-like NDP-sugar epimerase
MSLENKLIIFIKTHFSSLTLTVAFIFFLEPELIGGSFVLYFVAIAFGLTSGVHLMVRLILLHWRVLGDNYRYSLILGSGIGAETYLKKVKDNPQLGCKVIGYLAPQRNGLEIPYFGTYPQLESIISHNVVDTAVVTTSVTEEGIEESLRLLNTMGKKVVIIIDEMVAKVPGCRSIDFDGLSMVDLNSHPRNPWQEMCKLLFDFCASAVGLVLISPLMLVIALAIKATSKGPVIFSQERVGLNGRIFKMYKFRSMVINAEELKAQLENIP